MSSQRRVRLRSLASLVVCTVLATSSCQSAEELQSDDLPQDTAANVLAVALPDTTAASVQAYLDAQGYAATWDFWPGLEPLYPGTEPHGALLNTFLNDRAGQALTGRTADDPVGTLPHGSMIVKENHLPDSTLASVTVMYKVDGYDAEHGDWFWMKRLADGTVEASGRVASCAECHVEAADEDYLMTALR